MSRVASRCLLSAGLVLALIGLAVQLGCGGGAGKDESVPAAGENGEPSAPPGESEAEGEQETATDSSLTPLARRSVEIYFPSNGEEGGLISEFREIFDTATPGDQIKQILNDLISGPTTNKATRALPGGTRLRQAYVLDDGVAWLDFSSELTEGLGGGSETELLTIYSIVNSVTANIPQVRRVGILVNGRPVETLNGHVHLLKPLRPDFSLVHGSITVHRHDAATPSRRAHGKA